MYWETQDRTEDGSSESEADHCSFWEAGSRRGGRLSNQQCLRAVKRTRKKQEGFMGIGAGTLALEFQLKRQRL